MGMEGLTTVSVSEAREFGCADGLRVAPLEPKMRVSSGALGLAALFFAAAAGCADSASNGPSTGVAVSFELMKGGASIPCAMAPEISLVQVTVFASDGVSVRGGYP